MAVNNFDFVAPYYDLLVKVVFGRSILNAQLVHLARIQKKDTVLVLGGGTGKLLHHIPSCKTIDFVEKSRKMIAKARKRLENRVINFIHEDFLEYESKHQYDVIICPFFLDCFEKQNLEIVIAKCKSLISTGGYLITTDFESETSGKFLLATMHIFFGFTSNLESRCLKHIHEFVVSNGFELVAEISLHRNQLFSRLYTSF